MLALSIREPWSFLILRPDIKDPAVRAQMIADDKIKQVENRTWATKFRGPCWIHTGVKNEIAEVEYAIRDRFGITLPLEWPNLGGIVGVAEIVDCVRNHPSRWFVGPFGFVLKNARAVEFFPMKGRLLLWETGLELGDLKEL